MNQTPTPTQGSEPEDAPTYASLRDYVRVLQRQRLLIVAITVLFGAAALAYSLSKEERYSASSSLSFRDPLADLGLIGVDSTPEDAPQVRAAANAELITGDAVAERAAKILGSDASDDSFSAVSGQVSPQTNLVVVSAEADSGEQAAATANAFAVAAREVGSRDIRDRLERAEDSVLDELKQARKSKNATPLELQTLQTRLTAIAALRTIARPVEVAQLAGVPGSPVSPKPLRNTAIGLLVGLLIGIIAAFTRDALDRRLRTVQDVHRELGLPILGRTPEAAFVYPGLVPSTGSMISEADFEAFRVLRTNLAYLSPDEPAKTILVTSGMPEEGKTTVSLSLASAAALAGSRVLLVEADLRRPSLTRRMQLADGAGLAEYLREEATDSDVLRAVPIGRPWSASAANAGGPAESGLHFACITAGQRPAEAVERLGSDRFRHFLAEARESYDLVLLDGSPMLAVVDPLTLMPMVDATLLCVRVRQSDSDGARAVSAALENLPDVPVGVVVTGLSRGGPDAYEYYYGY